MKFITAALLTLLSLSSFAREIIIGTTPGDFAEMVKVGLRPELEKNGHTVKLVEFSDYVTPNIALAQGALDVNIFQHKPYLEQFAAEKGLKLSPLAQVPTAPLGIYAGKSKSLAQVKSGTTVAVPNDPSNLARALVILAELKWIELPAKADVLRVTPQDISKNLKGIKIIQLEAAQLPRSREDVDFAIINGNYATLSGLKLTDALAQEKSDAYVNWAVTKTSDLKAPHIVAVVNALNSESFKKYAKNRFKGYKLPSNWK